MKTAVCLTVGVMVLSAMVMTGRAEAATANGPYYAEPSWDQKLDAATRFVVLLNWNSEAVLDRETGLVWEQSLDQTARTWQNAHFACNQKTVGNRKGWRLPTIQDLSSLIDPSVPFPGPTLPLGHPFSNVVGSGIWSATSFASNTGFAWLMGLNTGGSGAFIKSDAFFAWCVRGGQAVDPQ